VPRRAGTSNRAVETARDWAAIDQAGIDEPAKYADANVGPILIT
jgi:hypothetical protein